MNFNYFWTDPSSKRNELTENYEPIQPFLFLQLAEEMQCQTIFDIGANIGFYSIISTLVPTVQNIYAFEAIEKTFSELEKNISLNGFQELIHAHNLGVSDKKKTIRFLTEDKELSGINTVKDSTFHNHNLFSNEVEINAVALDDMFSISNKYLGFKIDVEGHESFVLKGCKNLLKNNLSFIQIEIYPGSKELVNEQLISLGYEKIFELDNDMYYTNIEKFKNKSNMLALIEKSLKKVIQYKLGRYPENKSYMQANALVSQESIEVIIEKVSANFKGVLEYAFYLLVDGKKHETFWYQEENRIQIVRPENVDINRLSITCFVREKENINKKFMQLVKVIKKTKIDV